MKSQEREKAEFMLLDPLEKIFAMSEVIDILGRREELPETVGVGISKILRDTANEIFEIGQQVDQAA